MAGHVLPGGRALEHPGRAGEEPDLVDASAGSPRSSVSPIGLPVFSALDVHELVGPRLERVGDPEQRPLPLGSASLSRQLSNAAGGGRHRPVDVLRRRTAARWAYTWPVAGLTTSYVAPAGGVDVPAVDEVAQRLQLVAHMDS